MSDRSSAMGLAGAAIGALALSWSGTACAAAAPFTQDQLFHAFSGQWEIVDRISVEKMETMAQPLRPEYQAKKEAQTRNRAEGRQIFTSDAQCIPAGMPRMMINSSFEVLVRPSGLGLVTAGGGIQIRNIWTDGRKPAPSEDLFDSFSGESIGHWEDDTLVVDTKGLRPTNEILYGVQGHALTVHERFHKTAPDMLEVVTTVMDPVVFTEPWVYTTRYRRNLQGAISELNYCVAALDREVNNEGVEGFDLTPPKLPAGR